MFAHFALYSEPMPAAVETPSSPLPVPTALTADLRADFPTGRDCDRVFDLLARTREIVEGKPDGLETPGWCVARGWDAFLLDLSEAELDAGEGQGLAAVLPGLRNAPPTLMELAREVEAATEAPRPIQDAAAPTLPFQGLRPRKERQIAAMLALGRLLAERSQRLVDVGAGRGRFTEIAALLWNRPALGIEREPTRVGAARAAQATLAARAPSRPSPTEYHCVDVSEGIPGLGPGDLVLGLHACGDLGDAIVRAVVEARASLILVACCHQKIRGPSRAPLSRRAASRGMTFPRGVLGLANLISRSVGFEGPLSSAFEARAHRHALAHLLRARGVDRPLDSLRHARKRRHSFTDWPTFARQSLEAWGLPPASSAELQACLAGSIEELGRMRRLSLPRNLLARLLELALVLDRSCLLAEAGFEPRVVEVFSSAASPRNLALMASAPP